MRKIIYTSLTCFALFVVMALKSEFPSTQEGDYTDCLKKYEGKWGDECPDCKIYRDSYKVKLRNECQEKLDVMICVQETDKSWKRFMFYSMPPNDTMFAYACIGTGKYLKWAKKAGDKSITFPSIEEVNASYKE